jgi:hypothetical protein
MRAHLGSAHELSTVPNVQEIDSSAEHLRLAVFFPKRFASQAPSDAAAIYLAVTKRHGIPSSVVTKLGSNLSLARERPFWSLTTVEDLMKKAIVCVFCLAVLATPALAQLWAQEFWVVQDVSTKRCSVIWVRKEGFFGWPFAEKPTGLSVIKTAFKTRSEAEN